MKIITEPRVRVISSPVFHAHPNYPIPVDWAKDSNQVVSPTGVHNNLLAEDLAVGAFAAKGCYDSYGMSGRSCEENQRQIIDMRHGSVLEHIVIGLFIEGVTRGLSLELNRHRHLAISQRSTRYTAEEDAALVLEPYYAELYHKWFDGDQEVLDIDSVQEALLINEHIYAAQDAFNRYETEIEILTQLNPLSLEGTALRKWARGKARNILPHGLETRATYTGNLRCWRHIIETRSSRYAEPEIRRLVEQIFSALNTVLHPVYLEDYSYEFIDGFPEYTTPYSKV